MHFRLLICFLLAAAIWCVTRNRARERRVVSVGPTAEARQAEAAFSRNQKIQIWIEVFRPILAARQQESLDQLEERIRRRHFSTVAGE